LSRKLRFVDDDRNELERFKQAIASDELIVGTGTTLGEALNDLKAQGKRRFFSLLPPSRHVDLFVLDMYYPTGGSSSDAQLSKLGKAWDEFRAAEAVFKRVLAELGQDFSGGRTLAKQISSQRPLVATPFVFFTRKGNVSDAIEAYEHTKALSVIKKPDPKLPVNESERRQAYDRAMIDNRDNVLRALEHALHRANSWYRHRGLLSGIVIGVAGSAIFALVAWWGNALLRFIRALVA
jgi:hypothetical protein